MHVMLLEWFQCAQDLMAASTMMVTAKSLHCLPVAEILCKVFLNTCVVQILLSAVTLFICSTTWVKSGKVVLLVEQMDPAGALLETMTLIMTVSVFAHPISADENEKTP